MVLQVTIFFVITLACNRQLGMDHFIDHIEIRNFKSIRDLKLEGFKRINLFIGRPNVGKSNILEALSLFSLPYVWEGSRKLTDLVRISNQRELFYDGDINDLIQAKIIQKNKEQDNIEYYVSYDREKNQLGVVMLLELDKHTISINDFDWFDYTIDSKFKLNRVLGTRKELVASFLKPYRFKDEASSRTSKHFFLQPPFGANLISVLEFMPELRKVYAQWFGQYGLRLVLDTASQSLKIQKEKGGDEVFQLPYSSVAETLQRIIFYKTAVASNENSVLLFEEPEAHAYPPYIVEFTQEVIQSETNQLFIVTHSPLIVNDFLEGAIDDLAIFMVDFKDGQTVAKPLTRDEITEVHKYGVDLFFNNEAYLS